MNQFKTISSPIMKRICRDFMYLLDISRKKKLSCKIDNYFFY